ncbi:MAG: hypothetical protein AB7G93_06740 [Bdellovibrionales bacterium]
MYHRYDDLELWRTAFSRFASIGGNTVLFFASPVQKLGSYEASGQVTWQLRKRALDQCLDQGSSCVASALADYQRSGSALPLKGIYYFESAEDYEKYFDANCLGLNKAIHLPQEFEASYTLKLFRIFMPHTSGASCVTETSSYDVIFVKQLVDRQGKVVDGNLIALLEGAKAGMQLYLGTPDFPRVVENGAASNWNLDVESFGVYHNFVYQTYFMWRYKKGFTGIDSFAGVYQSFEFDLSLPASSYTNQALSEYVYEAELLHLLLPGRRYAISPYWISNIVMLNQASGGARSKSELLQNVRLSLERLIDGKIDVIAPQDSRGTGKTLLYGDSESEIDLFSVDPALRSYPDQSIFTPGPVSANFLASTAELYASARAALDARKAANSNLQTELWGNVEAFEGVPLDGSALPLTTKQRLDQAIRHYGKSVDRLISFMWDDLFIRRGSDGALYELIQKDATRPIPTLAFWNDSNSVPGLVVEGYHLASSSGAKVNVTWYDVNGGLRFESVPLSLGWIWNRATTSQPGRHTIWVPLNTGSRASWWVYVSITDGTGKESGIVMLR